MRFSRERKPQRPGDVASETAVPFEVRAPNAETEAAMRDARDGKVERHETIAALMTALNKAD